ncbi:pyridoxamine 5'-phosphate oxidase family protein [Streptomyces profundus]|uniref:pyridoxamine 5'-phosphate oxidase family protein n=1 Tax=Streptomyces profundus TaxID=2867410 RepID=UPI001D166333|nr:pyridoxamine 5'-phosphate oxidase family protein [Streptomyces sp. MA3_2.13]UED83543.1 pyridoxamine 5'-phosphate oxidase family protein [Streptomyces sp. MA3_2.13]
MTPSRVPSEPAVLARLARDRNVWLCTTRPDGSPHVTPVWFVLLGQTWWIGVDGSSVKARNIAHAPTVSLALEDGRHPVVAEGEARPHRAPFAAEVVDAFAAKYDWDVTVPHRPGGARLLIEVPVRRWLFAGSAD